MGCAHSTPPSNPSSAPALSSTGTRIILDLSKLSKTDSPGLTRPSSRSPSSATFSPNFGGRVKRIFKSRSFTLLADPAETLLASSALFYGLPADDVKRVAKLLQPVPNLDDPTCAFLCASGFSLRAGEAVLCNVRDTVCEHRLFPEEPEPSPPPERPKQRMSSRLLAPFSAAQVLEPVLQGPGPIFALSPESLDRLRAESPTFDIYSSQFLQHRVAAKSLAALRRVAVLAHLTESELESFRALLGYKKLAFNDRVGADEFVLVCDGHLQLRSPPASLSLVRNSQVHHVGPGEWIGERALFKVKHFANAPKAEYEVTIPGVCLFVKHETVLKAWSLLLSESTRARLKQEALIRQPEALKSNFKLLAGLSHEHLVALSAFVTGLRVAASNEPFARHHSVYFVQQGLVDVEGELRRRSVGAPLFLVRHLDKKPKRVGPGGFLCAEALAQRLLLKTPVITRSTSAMQLPRSTEDLSVFKSASAGDLMENLSNESACTLLFRETTVLLAIPEDLLGFAVSASPERLADFELCVLQHHCSFEAVVNHELARPCFSAFLRQQFAIENLEFWLTVRDYEAKWCKVFLNITDEAQNAARHAEAKLIFEKFIDQNSPCQINIESASRTSLHMVICNTTLPPPPNVFASAQSEIYTLMQTDAFPRFRKSALFEQMLKTVGAVPDVPSITVDTRSRRMSNSTKQWPASPASPVSPITPTPDGGKRESSMGSKRDSSLRGTPDKKQPGASVRSLTDSGKAARRAFVDKGVGEAAAATTGTLAADLALV